MTDLERENTALRENARLARHLGARLGKEIEDNTRLRAHVATLVQAGRALIAKLAVCEENAKPVYLSAAQHGILYRGETYEAERDELDDLLNSPDLAALSAEGTSSRERLVARAQATQAVIVAVRSEHSLKGGFSQACIICTALAALDAVEKTP
jgi:hypothetical protein